MDFLFVSVILIWVFHTVTSTPLSADQVILLDTSQDNWKDWKTNSGKYSGWRSQNIPPDGDKVFGICMVHRNNNDNWLYSPIIPTGEAHSIIVETYFSMRSCKNYPDRTKLRTCENTIYLSTYKTNNLRESTNQNNRFFTQTEVLYPHKQWSKSNSDEPTMNSHKAVIQVKTLGIRIAYRDTGSCTMIRRMQVYYLACPAVVDSFTEFSRTVSKHIYDLVSVVGQCVKGAVQIIKDANQLQSRFCQSNGQWHKMETVNCHCGPGFTASFDWKTCIPCASRTYKLIPGPSKCLYCPKFSNSEIGQSNCDCEEGSFPKDIMENGNIQMLCLKLPSSPINLRANVTDGSKVILTWEVPNQMDADDQDSIIYYQISCYKCSLSEVQFEPGRQTSGTNVTMFGLTFGESYLFYVTSMASISNYSKNNGINPSRSSVRFYLSKTNSMTVSSVKTTGQANLTILVAWKEPQTIKPAEMYMVQLENVWNSNSTGFHSKYEYKFTKETKLLYTIDPGVTKTFAKVRYKYNGIWSDPSSEILSNSIFQGIVSTEKYPKLNKSILLWIPNLDIVLLCITSVVIIIIVISLTAILMRKYVNMRMKRTTSRKPKDVSFIDNTKSFYASISASSPSKERSYFYLSSTDNLAESPQRVLNEIQPDLIIMKTLKRLGKFYDVYDGSMKQPRRLPMNITLTVFKLELEDEIISKILNDCQDISQFQHENIINILGFCTTNSPKMMLTEYMVHGCLNPFLKKNEDKINMCRLMIFLHNIACGMKFLSERKFIHKKLSTHNIFIDESMVCKISVSLLNWTDDTDLKTGKKFIDENKRYDITAWMAPEIYLENMFSTSSDVWAYGVTMWEIFSFGENPYWDWTSETIRKVILDGYRLPPPKNCCYNLHILMLRCWIFDTCQRINFVHILKTVDQIMNCLEKHLICLSHEGNATKPIITKKCKESSQDCIYTSILTTKNNNDNSIGIINIDNLQCSKQSEINLSNKRSCSSFISTPSIENENISSNIYLTSTVLKNENLSQNYKNVYSNETKSNNFSLGFRDSKINLDCWLSEINLRKYKRLFVKNGYSSRSKLAYISIGDLTDMGIKKACEIQSIMNNAHLLRNDYSI